MKRYRTIGIVVIALVLLNVVAQVFVVRHDLTYDKRYSLNDATKELVRSLDGEVAVTLFLDGELNSGFRRLQQACKELVGELGVYGKDWTLTMGSADEAEQMRLSPTVIHERTQDGRTAQTMVYPYMCIRYNGRVSVVSLLRNNRGKSGEENLNESIESLEYQVAEALEQLRGERTQRVAFLEGHGELDEVNVQDVTVALSRYFQVDRGVLGTDASVLDDYAAVIVADNGKGFDPESVKKNMGLRNIQERVELLEGRMNISSSSAGTEINIELPH